LTHQIDLIKIVLVKEKQMHTLDLRVATRSSEGKNSKRHAHIAIFYLHAIPEPVALTLVTGRQSQ
jgi:hypothetical protein